MPYTPVRLTPDAEALVIAILKAGSVPKVSTEAPANLYTVLPYVVAYRFGGSSDHLRLRDRATFQVQAWGASRELAADLAETCRVLLFQAALKQQTVVGVAGYVNRFTEVSAPAEIRTADQPDRTWRFDATYSLRIRPTP